MTDPDVQVYVFNKMDTCTFGTKMEMNDLSIKRGDQNVTMSDYSNKKQKSLAQVTSAKTPDQMAAEDSLKALLIKNLDKMPTDKLDSLAKTITK